MAFTEKPPILTGRNNDDIANLRDYLFRMAQSLNEVVAADAQTETGIAISYGKDGTQILKTGGGAVNDDEIAKVRKNAQELRSLIIKSAKDLQDQIDSIENSTFYIKYADDFAGDYPETMYNTPTENTYYMGVCSSTAATAPTDPAAYSWSRIKGDGGTGLNSATVFLYRRANSPPNRPQVDLTYTFASGRLDLGPASVSGHKLVDADMSVTGHKVTMNSGDVEGHLASVTGWTQEIPNSDGRPCWVITATAIATTATDVIASTEWSEVKKLVEDGEAGANGRDGINGAQGEKGDPGDKGDKGDPGNNGLDGYSTALVYLYKRSSASSVSVDWTDSLTYNFLSKMLATIPTGWNRYPPSGSDPLWVTAATASSRENTDTIAYTEWSSPVIMAENGQDGIQGPTGPDGRTTYLHIKYSDDGETFTPNQGEDMGAWIGMYTDFNIVDSLVFSDYEWHRFADDTELQAAIEAGDAAVMRYVDSKVEEYNELYVAQSEFGTFQENVTSMITTTARGVVESYDYGSSIESVQSSIDLLQSYYTSIQGEIRRGIVEDPDTGEYVTGIAIAQALKFSGECGPTDPQNPGDGYTYYYMNSGQTFGLYTSVGWQFWIDGYKKGWYNSTDGMLHVANVLIEQVLQIGSSWQIKSSGDGSELEFLYVGS